MDSWNFGLASFPSSRGLFMLFLLLALGIEAEFMRFLVVSIYIIYVEERAMGLGIGPVSSCRRHASYWGSVACCMSCWQRILDFIS